MLTTVNFFHGNVFYIARRAKLAWLLLARATLSISQNSRWRPSPSWMYGHFQLFFPGGLQGRVIPIYRGFRGWRVYFWRYILDAGSRSRSNQRSNVKLGKCNVSLLILFVRQIQIQIQNCLFDIVCQVIVQHTLCIINVRRLPLRQ